MAGAISLPDRLTKLQDFPASMTGHGLKHPRVNDGGTALEFDTANVDIINVEEARSDIRSTTRAGYETFDSQPGIQALLDVMPSGSSLHFPSNGIFNLNSKLITTTQTRQGVVSSGGMGAELVNGGIALRHSYGRVKNLRLTGASAVGLDIDAPHASLIDVYNVHIQNKTLALDVKNVSTYLRFTLLNLFYNTTGTILDYSGTTGDYGDVFFSQCNWVGNGLGMHWKKVGGVNMIGCKIVNGSLGGLLIESQNNLATNSPLWGNYIGNCTFEDNANYDLKVSALAGVNVTHYPRRLQIVGGEVHKLYLDKCYQISLEGVLLPITVNWSSNASSIMASNCPELRERLTGSCTSYIIMGCDGVKDGFIQVGGGFNILDNTRITGARIGPHITSIASIPAYIGQFAVVSGIGYMATGTGSIADWKQITA